MFMLHLLVAAAAMPAPAPLLSPATAQDIRCVALLAIVAGEQARGKGWSDLPPLGDDGKRYAAVAGEAAMKEGPRTREAVRDLILAQVAVFKKAGTLPPAEVSTCIKRMEERAPPPPLPTLLRCAAILSLKADEVRTRDGLTKGTNDLATLASVLAYRAKMEGAEKGQTERQVSDAIAAERATAAKAGGAGDDEIQDCAQLAAADQ